MNSCSDVSETASDGGARGAYQERWREEVLNKPKLDRALRVLEHTQDHD